MSTENTPLLPPLPCPLYPEIESYAVYSLAVGDGHTLYVEECGNPRGLPVVVLHGGPGSGCSPNHRRRFNPAVYRIICFDQRGAGRSVQADGLILKANTTAHLVDDIEKIRVFLGVEAWVVYGTSWGSTLALVYAEAHPARVKGLIVGGIFLADTPCWDWWCSPHGLRQIYPVQYEALQAFYPHVEGMAMVEAISAGLMAGDEGVIPAARAMNLYECMGAALTPDPVALAAYLDTPEATRALTIETAYFGRRCDLADGQILAHAGRIGHIPTFILQGQLDLVCPPGNAHRLHAALPQSQLIMVPLCGHRGNEAMEAVRVQASDKMARILGA